MTKTDTVLRCVDDSGAEGEFYALDRAKWREVRRVHGKDKGKPYTVPENCIIKLPVAYKNKQLRIFVEIMGDGDGDNTDCNTEEISE
jgi:hypothetical protein